MFSQPLHCSFHIGRFGGAQAINCIYCEWVGVVDCIPPSLSPSGITLKGSYSLHEMGMRHLRSWLLPCTIPSLEPHIISTVTTASGPWNTWQLHTKILKPDFLIYRHPFVQTWHTGSWWTYVPFSLHKMIQPSLFTVKKINKSLLVSDFTGLKLLQPMNLHTSRNTGHEKSQQ